MIDFQFLILILAETPYSHSSAAAAARNPNLGALGAYGHYVPTAATSGIYAPASGPPPLTGAVNENVAQRYIGNVTIV